MNYPDFVRTLCKPGDAILNSMSANKAHLLHMSMGLMGEAVEFMKGFNENNLNNMIEELGDYKFFHVGLQNDLPEWQGEPKAEKLPVYDNCVLGLVYSAEQVLDSVKKYIIYDNPEALEKVHRNMYMAHCAYGLCLQLIPISDAEICDRNIAKLTTRYHEGQYSDASAKARADKKGEPDSPLTPKEVRLNPQQQAQEMLMATMLRNALQVDISGRMLQFVAGRISTRVHLQNASLHAPLQCVPKNAPWNCPTGEQLQRKTAYPLNQQHFLNQLFMYLVYELGEQGASSTVEIELSNLKQVQNLELNTCVNDEETHVTIELIEVQNV